MVGDFHFLEPLWLLALSPLAGLWWLARKPLTERNAWQKVCDAHLMPFLLVNGDSGGMRLRLWLVTIGWLIAVLALANPAWEKRPTPVLKTRDARVVVLDLSRSMNAADLQPSRLIQARFKVADILKRSEEGQTGLVAFAGDAFIVSPLTQDADTIASLLSALEPAVMPAQGSRADLGLRKAAELLEQAGVDRGEVLLLADGFEGDLTNAAAKNLHEAGHRLSVLAIGTEQGAPIPTGRGDFVKDATGHIIVPSVDFVALQSVAEDGGGSFTPITADDRDLTVVLAKRLSQLDLQTEQTEFETEIWNERGPWLLMLLVPLAAFAFRRGWLLVLVAVVSTVSTPEPAMAFTWDDLWQRPDQQAARALQDGDFGRAAQLAKDPMRRGSALYRSGDAQKALEAFANTEGADASYNRGNALAKLGRYEDAITAYDEALAEQPAMEDARYNRQIVEQLLRRQQQQEQANEQSQQSGNQPNDDQYAQSGNQNEGPRERESQASTGNSEQNSQGQSGAEFSPEASRGKTGKRQFAGVDAEEREDQSEPDSNERGGAHEEQSTSRSQGSEQTEQEKDPVADGKEAGTNAEQTESPGNSEHTSREDREQLGERTPDADVGNADAPWGTASADPISSEEQQAVEQWLRRIPDDPAGLLRRKFLYQYQQRAAQATADDGQTW